MTAPTREQSVLGWTIHCDLIDSRDIDQEFVKSIPEKLKGFSDLAYEQGQKDEREVCTNLIRATGEKMKPSLDNKVIVGDYVMLDPTIYPPPKHQQVLCGSMRHGTTIKGVFDPKHHDCWLPMPKFPESVKERYRVEVENGKT